MSHQRRIAAQAALRQDHQKAHASFRVCQPQVFSNLERLITPMSKATHPLLGAHMSIAGSVGEAFLRGKQAGCECIQIFTKSARQWASKPYTPEEIAGFKRNQKETGITKVIAHDSYLLNLGAPDDKLRKRSVAGFVDELERCE